MKRGRGMSSAHRTDMLLPRLGAARARICSRQTRPCRTGSPPSSSTTSRGEEEEGKYTLFRPLLQNDGRCAAPCTRYAAERLNPSETHSVQMVCVQQGSRARMVGSGCSFFFCILCRNNIFFFAPPPRSRTHWLPMILTRPSTENLAPIKSVYKLSPVRRFRPIGSLNEARMAPAGAADTSPFSQRSLLDVVISMPLLREYE